VRRHEGVGHVSHFGRSRQKSTSGSTIGTRPWPIRLRELLARDVREHDAEPKRHDRFALIRVTLQVDEPPVTLDLLIHIETVPTRIFERIHLSNHTARGHELHFRLVSGRDRVEPLVLDLEH
jgi:hypothetical protein